MKRGILLVSSLLLSGCVQTYYPNPYLTHAAPARPLLTQDQTAGVENNDRINRFGRLAALQGIAPPLIEQVILPPGSVNYMAGPVPVVRVVFNEGVFFDSASDQPKPEAAAVLDVIADNMRHDVPDAAVTVLGHTDAQGSDDYNVDLSRRRATNVMTALVSRGVNPDQLSEVAIGKRQPIAPNSTTEGRARNRRVEFIVSSGIDANLAAVSQRVVPASFFAIAAGEPVDPTRIANRVSVGKLRPQSGSASIRPLDDFRDIALAPPASGNAIADDSSVINPEPNALPSTNPIAPVAVQNTPTAAPRVIAPAPARPVHLAPLAPAPNMAPLGDTQY